MRILDFLVSVCQFTNVSGTNLLARILFHLGLLYLIIYTLCESARVMFHTGFFKLALKVWPQMSATGRRQAIFGKILKPDMKKLDKFYPRTLKNLSAIMFQLFD